MGTLAHIFQAPQGGAGETVSSRFMNPLADFRRVFGWVAKPGPANWNAAPDCPARLEFGQLTQPKPIVLVPRGKVSQVCALKKNSGLKQRMMHLQGLKLADGLPAGERPLSRCHRDRWFVTAFRHSVRRLPR